MSDNGHVLASQTGLDIGQATDVGRVREANEDALLTLARPTATETGVLLVAVADGMGGHKAGEVASALAVEALRETVSDADDTVEPDNLLIDAIERANRDIWEAAAQDVDKEGMGTTLVCALVTAGGNIAVANVGDSRAYLINSNEAATLITTDHTWVQQQVDDGHISAGEARTSPYRNLLTRSLGSTQRVTVDLFRDKRLERGDALVLVSDGVTGYLDEGDLATILRACATAQDAAEQLVAEAVKRGGADNATAVVVRRL